MSLREHAEAELRRAGWLDGDGAQSGQAILDAVEAFARGGWSGGSAPYGIHIVNDLLNFRPLGPLTDDPDEWMHIAEAQAGQRDLWQSRRRADAFSNDGGRTYRLQDDARVRYDRGPWLLWKLRLRERPPGFVRGSDYARTKLHRSQPAKART